METAAPVARKLLREVPPQSKFDPVKGAIERATQLGENSIASVLKQFSAMPPSTNIIANPVQHQTKVDCDGTEILLEIRAFTIRGIVAESEIVAQKVSPIGVIFAGLFGRQPRKFGAIDEENLLAGLINRRFFQFFGLARKTRHKPHRFLQSLAEFLREFPTVEPELVIQHFSALRKAWNKRTPWKTSVVNNRRRADFLLLEMVNTHLENVALAGASAYMRRVIQNSPGISAAELADRTVRFVEQEKEQLKDAFQICFSFLLGRSATPDECAILERMGAIQTHHGSAGSNMVARYLAALHTLYVSDLFVGSQLALESARHFGAIHDMTIFLHELQQVPAGQQDDFIRKRILTGSLPTFGHPEIAAAGRHREIQMDPRPAVYLAPLFSAIDANRVSLSKSQVQRLSVVQRIYQLAFVEGVKKPGRENEDPLRLTPNTDFGAWCVQEAMGIEEADRTFITYIYRGFGWMMDIREQLQQPIIRPVIPPDPAIVPKTGDHDPTIPELIQKVHKRLSVMGAFEKSTASGA
ncbi:MAG TPA: citrate/2-methylcitrate synthase [Candidatus Angelobacter sp.]|nr:citrate/2-methylcitrate synthase [Candidatus Angelobacter sp.]